MIDLYFPAGTINRFFTSESDISEVAVARSGPSRYVVGMSSEARRHSYRAVLAQRMRVRGGWGGREALL